MEKTKLTKNEYLESLDPDNLNLEKSDLIDFCHGCIAEWKKNKIAKWKNRYYFRQFNCFMHVVYLYQIYFK